MTAPQRLDDYLNDLRLRLQKAIALRSGAVAALCVLAILSATIVWLTPLGFPRGGVVVSRVVLLLAVIVVVSFWWLRQRRLRRDEGAAEFELRLPAQQGRIQTYLELQRRSRQGVISPMIDLLADDALSRVRDIPIERVISTRQLTIAATLGIAALLAVVSMLAAGNSPWGYGSRHLLLGASLPASAVPIKQVNLLPGDITVRRNADLNIQAEVRGFKPKEVELYVRFDAEPGAQPTENSTWEHTLMQTATDAPAKYARTLYALRSPLKYYVIADGVKSDEHAVKVVDVPHVNEMQLTYAYPEWTGLPRRKEREQRDIQAVADTRVEIAVKASEALVDAALVIDDQPNLMQAHDNGGNGSLVVAKPARYHIASRVAGEMVALTDEYDIAVLKDEAPTIEIVKPGRDWRASSIEEVPVMVKAQDDFRVQSAELRYAVNGGEWRSIKLPANAAQMQAKTQLSMEELGGKTPLAPGDLVTYYAITHDRKQSAQTDLYMVQVQPFERRFTESQGGGGGGGGGEGNEQQEIAERQKDLLLATWNLQRSREQQKRTPQQLQDNGQMLSDLQAKLAQQTKTLAERTRARARVDSDARLKKFVESLEQAAGVMQPVAEDLKHLELPKAIPGEQQALQLLLRAESAFRDIQVARQQGAAGGGGSRTSRDISELYELEMDLNKNQYETEKQLTEQTASQEVDEALAKLKELARRQEQLAQQRQQQQTPTNAERWKQEQLRREAEELRRQLQQLAQQSQSGQSSQGNDTQSNGNQSTGNQSGEVNAALNAVDNALQAMRNATNNDANNKAKQQSAEQATRNLQQAAQRLQRKADAPDSDSVEKLADQARRLADQQRQLEVELYKAASGSREGERGPSERLTQQRIDAIAESKTELEKGVQDLESHLRDATTTNRKAQPQTAKRLGEIAEELATANVASRLSRSITDIQRGRGDQIAIGEGIITQALENAANELRDTVKLAAREGEQKSNAVDPQALLAELAELRRALATAQTQNTQRNSSRENGAQSRQNQNDSQSQNRNPAGGQSSGQSGDNWRDGGYGGGYRAGNNDTLRWTNGVRQQFNAIENRINAGTTNRDDILALRALEPQLRRLRGGPMPQLALQATELSQHLDRLELAALAAAEKAHKTDAARAGASTPTATQENEAVAEYYRRLGK